MKQINIAIVGAGITGLTAALALSKKGFSQVRVFERAEVLSEAGAGIQLGPNAVRELGKLGLAETLEAVSDSCQWGELRQGSDNRFLAKLPFSEHSKRAYGAPCYQILRTDLQHLLHQQVLAAGVTIEVGRQLTSCQQKPYSTELYFADGRTEVVDLMIAADGIDSVVTRQWFPDSPLSYAGLACWRTLIDSQILPGQGWQRVRLWIGEGRHLISYPVANSSKLNIVALKSLPHWSGSSRIQASHVNDWLAAFEGFCPEVMDMIAQVEQTSLWGLFERPHLPSWHSGHAVLLGDAAHPMLPSLAQAAAQGIEDAACLAELLSRLQTPVEIEDCLARFYSTRIRRVQAVQSSARWNLNYFHQQNGVLSSVRNLLMRAGGPLTTKIIASRYHWLYRAR